MKKKPIKICAISDTHLKHWQLAIPECDIFLFAGDAHIRDYYDLEDFNKWLGIIQAKYKIIIAGNHCSYLSRLSLKDKKLFFTNATYLENETIKIKGIKIFGSPYSKEFNRWHYMRQDSNLQMIWDLIEPKTNIVLVHGPAYGWLDQNVDGENCGSRTLRNTIEKLKIPFLVCGHLHESSNILETKHTTIINASVLDENYQVRFEPKVFYIEK